MKETLIRLACGILSWYFRRFPISSGKLWVWDHVVRRYVVWRTLPIEAVTKFGATFRDSFPDVLHTYLYFFGVWEPGVTRVFASHLRPGDVVIDIGSNVGAHTALAATLVGVTGRVHAIEASPSIYARLKANLELNGLGQVIPHNVAVSDHAEPVTVFLNEAINRSGTTTLPSEAARRGAIDKSQVEGYPLADIVPLDDIRRARLIKIDVEGFEWPVLRGMIPVMELLPDDCAILIEANAEALADFASNVTEFMAFFTERGWRAVEIANSYKPDFYIRTPKTILNLQIRLDAGLLDLAFARPAVIQDLLDRDRDT